MFFWVHRVWRSAVSQETKAGICQFSTLFLSLTETEWLEDNVLGFQALPENTGSPLSCFQAHSWSFLDKYFALRLATEHGGDEHSNALFIFFVLHDFLEYLILMSITSLCGQIFFCNDLARLTTSCATSFLLRCASFISCITLWSLLLTK